MEHLCYTKVTNGTRGGTMAIENGEWIMRGLDWDDPVHIQSREEREAVLGWSR